MTNLERRFYCGFYGSGAVKAARDGNPGKAGALARCAAHWARELRRVELAAYLGTWLAPAEASGRADQEWGA